MSAVIDLTDRRVGHRHTTHTGGAEIPGTVRSFEHLSGLRPMRPDREARAMGRLPYYGPSGPRRPDGGGDAA